MGANKGDWRERRRKQIRRQRIVILSALIAIIAIVIIGIVTVIVAVTHHKKNQEAERQELSDSQNVQQITENIEDETEQQAAEEDNYVALSPDPALYTGEEPFQWTMDNVQYEDLENINTEMISWGIGPSRDDLNRPYDALSYQEKYGKYQTYFIRDDVTEKVVYLTFDEGYEYGFTPSILDTLKEKNVKAVFFVTLPFIKENPDLVQRMIDEGHIVGNHTVTHPSDGLPSLATLEDQAYEVTTVHDYMKENFDYEMWLFRYPTGKFNEQSLALINNLGYASLFWTFAYLDYDVNNQPSEEEALAKMEDKICPGSIMLLHGESETNAKVLGTFIDWGREQGYTFAQFYPISQDSDIISEDSDMVSEDTNGDL